jgi:uncharacterized membrane protein YhaH (DUF805 family)
MSSPSSGSDPNYPQGGAPQGQPGWGAPQQPDHPPQSYGAAPTYSGNAGGTPSLGLPDAVRSVLSQYANFTGRARRSEFWWFYLAQVIASIVAGIIDGVIGYPIFQIVVGLGLLIPLLAVGARRLHDTGKSGWWQLIGIVPLVGIILLIVWWAQDGHPAPNQHGPSPKYQAAGGY